MVEGSPPGLHLIQPQTFRLPRLLRKTRVHLLRDTGFGCLATESRDALGVGKRIWAASKIDQPHPVEHPFLKKKGKAPRDCNHNCPRRLGPSRSKLSRPSTPLFSDGSAQRLGQLSRPVCRYCPSNATPETSKSTPAQPPTLTGASNLSAWCLGPDTRPPDRRAQSTTTRSHTHSSHDPKFLPVPAPGALRLVPAGF